MNLGGEMQLEIVGLGIIMYSPSAAKHISRGEDYLATRYETDDQVQPHIQAGTIVGFGTGTPGNFTLRFRMGFAEDEPTSYEYWLQLGIHVTDRCVCFRDLYDLMEWDPDCPSEQKLSMDNGYYEVGLGSNKPSSGVLGDHQTIDVRFRRSDRMPVVDKEGVPTLCG